MGHICIDLPNTNNKWVEFGLMNVSTFIIGLANVDTIRTLTQHEHNPSTIIATPRRSHYLLERNETRNFWFPSVTLVAWTNFVSYPDSFRPPVSRRLRREVLFLFFLPLPTVSHTLPFFFSFPSLLFLFVFFFFPFLFSLSLFPLSFLHRIFFGLT